MAEISQGYAGSDSVDTKTRTVHEWINLAASFSVPREHVTRPTVLASPLA